MTNYVYTDGAKAVSLTSVEGWSYFSNAPKTEANQYFARVAAAFRAFHLKANTVSNIPFVLIRGNTEYDNSATWKNKVGFLPNPSEFFRLGTLSYLAKNSIYNLMTSDALGYKPRGLYNLTPYSCEPVLSSDNTKVEYIERTVGTRTERYSPDGKQIMGDAKTARMIYLWRLDHTTEILPSENTEAAAVMNSAGVLLYADTWIKHFFERGGVKPMVIGMKGAIDPNKGKDEEEKWTNWYLGLRDRFRRIFRVVNADMLDVKDVGTGVDQLKDNETYNQAIANIAMGHGMPLSLLLANSANYATAKEEKATWYESDIIPFCNWLAYEYNRQVFEPIGLRLEFRPETLDPQQEDETQRATAFSLYGDAFAKFPTYGLWRGMASTLGLEVSDDLDAAAQEFYTDKEKKEQEMRDQMAQGGYVLGADGKPVPAQAQPKEGEKEGEKEKEKPKFAKWIPSLDELEELKIYRKAALQRLKRNESMDFEYKPHHGGLPAWVMDKIAEGLQSADDGEKVKALFDASNYTEPEKQDNAIKQLADSINRYADALFTKSQFVST